MEKNYWNQISRKHLSRRSALTLLGGSAASAAFLAACGGDDDSSSSTGGTANSGATGSATGAGSTGASNTGLLFTPTDQVSQAKRGGTLNINFTNRHSFEQTLNGSGNSGELIPHVYSQLFTQAMGTWQNPPNGETIPQHAESYEVSPDGLTVTVKLRELTFDQRSPTNGRVATAEDVKYSWERWEGANVRAPELSNNVEPDAPVIGFEATDDKTAVITLAFPFAPLTQYFSSSFFPWIYPVEAEDGFDTREVARGAGAWTTDGVPGDVDFLFKRRTDYPDDLQPYFDEIHYHNLPEYAALYSQFSAGAIDWEYTLTQEDVLALKKDNPELLMYQRPFMGKGCGGVFFGRRPDSPWNDIRVRQALSMGIDRTLWADSNSDREKYEAEGLPIEVKWMSGAGPGYNWWLDPEKDELGEASKNLQYNPEEAHKLLVATGLDLPIKSVWNTPASYVVPGNESMIGLMQASGDFEFTTTNVLENQVYFDTVRNTGGDFDGIGIGRYFDHHDFDWTLMLKYHPGSTDFWMRIAGEDPKITDFVNRQRRELDTTARESIFQDFLKYDVEQLNYIPHELASWKIFYVAQPWMGNWGWTQPYIEQNLYGPGQLHDTLWFDESKKPS